MLNDALQTICAESSLQLKTHYVHPLGYIIDAEVKRELVEESDSKIDNILSPKSAMFILLDRRDWTMFNKKLCGPRLMAINHLTKSGNAVISVSYGQFSQMRDKTHRIQYVKNLLRKNGVFDALKTPQP
ncbi:unnamed protein product [Soboliphyme baturini]|uniref:RAP domain-containing protein n=1 Tax=Soboliphyme baturini TaxID=241478 RepID=A0A183IAI0_9BILA|nr:unnamed protein product [Soboliphyme baturini]